MVVSYWKRRGEISCVPSEVKDLSGGICFDILAGGHHDEANSPEKHSDEKSLGTSPSIHQLGKDNLGQTGKQAGNDTNNGSE